MLDIKRTFSGIFVFYDSFFDSTMHGSFYILIKSEQTFYNKTKHLFYSMERGDEYERSVAKSVTPQTAS